MADKGTPPHRTVGDKLPASTGPDEVELHLVARVISDLRHTLASQGRMRMVDAGPDATLSDTNSFPVDHAVELAACDLALAVLERWKAKDEWPLDDLLKDDRLRALLRGHPALARWSEARDKRRLEAERISGTAPASEELSQRLVRALYGPDAKQ